MNYLRTYCALIKKARSRNVTVGYYEKHHIFPVSIFGTNNSVVKLTAKEHYIAHALLVKICKRRYGINHKNTHKMIYAYNLMYNRGTCKTGALYEHYRKYFCENHPNKSVEYRKRKRREMLALGENNPSKKPEIRKMMSERWKGENNPMKREDVKKKIGEQMTKRMLTEKNPTRGKKRPEHANRMSKYVYVLISPDGEQFITHNMKQFCREQNLIYDSISKCKNYYKGWKIVSKTLKN